MRVAGPMWVGDLVDPSFCDRMIFVSERTYISSNRRLVDIIRLVKEETNHPPWFFNLDKICSTLKIASLKTDKFFKAIRSAGFKAAPTHIEEKGVKTEASINEIKEVLMESKEGIRGG